MSLITGMGRAYVNHGRWIADCPMECGNAHTLEPNELMFQCIECLAIVTIDWPSDVQEIWDALMERPVPKTRNWFPIEHELALRAGCPHGQTAAQLREEALEHLHPRDPKPVDAFVKADKAVSFVREIAKADRK